MVRREVYANLRNDFSQTWIDDSWKANGRKNISVSGNTSIVPNKCD